MSAKTGKSLSRNTDLNPEQQKTIRMRSVNPLQFLLSAIRMAIREQEPHFVMLPFMAQGHMIPMVDLARLLAERGLAITILTTPHNAARFQSVIGRAIGSGLNIHISHLKFPCSEVGLPDGCENFDMLPSIEDAMKFFTAMGMLKEQVEEMLRQLKPPPSCLIADMCFPWATDVALKLQIPRILFNGMGCFSLLCMHMLAICKDWEAITSDTECFVVPGLPDRFEITKAQLRGTPNDPDPDARKFWDQIREAEVEAFGTVVNSFEELEPEYIKEYMKAKGKRVWCVGPVSLCNKDYSDKSERGNKASIAEHECLKWLDSKEPGSVVYVCLGSLSRTAASQLIELGLALEASNRPFIWVLRHASEEFQTWLLEEKFEERIKNRGLLIRGWAPQVLILSHLSVGGFLTHCGWNSTLEGITAGVPMITWPLFAEQIFNEKLIVNVIKTGIRAGVEEPVLFGQEEKAGVKVKNDEIKRVIERLMDGGEEGNERRKRAKEVGEMAKRAVEEGGSSYLNMTLFIEHVIAEQATCQGRTANHDNALVDHENNDILIVP
ncbi:UDP-glycosyltransferase 73E1 [Sesamum alatum]|uniref:Glycosyltransferase n=1 Tax=Sesamum alatum TaxID=300844 RepID=A0AAE1YM64_9LAMI|nr:UDP-glycosyltransferase 73E1 [Sesamum alatum]